MVLGTPPAASRWRYPQRHVPAGHPPSGTHLPFWMRTITRARLSSGPAILSFLTRHGITHAAFTPSWLAALPAAELPELRSVICGGVAPFDGD